MTDISDRAWARAQLDADHKRLDVAVEGGKLRLIQAADGNYYAFRHDDFWPAFGRAPVFDNLTTALAQEIVRLREGMQEIADFSRKYMRNEEATAQAIDDLLAGKE